MLCELQRTRCDWHRPVQVVKLWIMPVSTYASSKYLHVCAAKQEKLIGDESPLLRDNCSQMQKFGHLIIFG